VSGARCGSDAEAAGSKTACSAIPSISARICWASRSSSAGGSALDGLAAPGVECAEWGGWVWGVLAGLGTAPPLLDWLGPEITTDLGVSSAYRRNILNDREYKITAFHRSIQATLDLAVGRS
jgi:hypothetical protein